MAVHLTFHGATRTVTGSCMELSSGKTRVLVDCGMFQGSRTLEELNRAAFSFNPRDITALLLTHAHIDHCGLIPRLVKDGFTGQIYCTEPTIDLLKVSLPDSGRIQESDAMRRSVRNVREGKEPIEPNYTEEDAQESLKLCKPIALEQSFNVGDLTVRYWNAGHILGSGSIEVQATDIRILFSGDIGPDEKAFYEDPEAPTGFDYVISESTYGNREKPDVTMAQRRDLLEQAVDKAMERGGNLIIPAFAIERTQELLLDLAVLMNAGRIKRAQVFVDSPLANSVTKIFDKYRDELHDLDGENIFRHPQFHFTESAEQSMQLNKMSGAIIMAASGMCDAGRIRHHLKHNLWRPDSTIMFVGYQAEGSLGRVIMDGAKKVRINGEDIAVRAHITKVDHYSAHADQKELLNWIKERMPIHGGVFLTHGEQKAMEVYADLIAGLGIGQNRVIRPELGETYALKKAAAAERVHAARAEAKTVVGKDWRNDQAEMSLDLKSKLQNLPDDKSRMAMLKKMRAVLDGFTGEPT
jgi:metallo-beta-lactamase family protein